MLDKNAALAIAERYAGAVVNEFSPFAVVLFGSYTNGNANGESDIDVGVVFDGFNGDWIKTSARLWDIAYDISWDIEPHMLDTAQDKSGFARHVLKAGKVIYKRSPYLDMIDRSIEQLARDEGKAHELIEAE